MATSGSLPMSLDDYAKRHLGISSGSVPPHYLAELKRFSLEYPTDLNFRITVDSNYGVVHCLENGCEGIECALGTDQDAPLGGKGTVGSLLRYRLHIRVHPTHIKARNARIAETIENSKPPPRQLVRRKSPDSIIELSDSEDEQDKGPPRKKTKTEVVLPKSPHTAAPRTNLSSDGRKLPTLTSIETEDMFSPPTPGSFPFHDGIPVDVATLAIAISSNLATSSSTSSSNLASSASSSNTAASIYEKKRKQARDLLKGPPRKRKPPGTSRHKAWPSPRR